MTEEKKKKLDNTNPEDQNVEVYSVMPLRNTVLFPQQVIPIYVGREKSLKLIGNLDKKNKYIVVVAQEDGSIENPKPEDLYVYSSDRIANLTGNGVLTFTHSKYNLDKLFTEDEMVFYDSNNDLIEKIVHFLKNDEERRRIAKNGWKKARRELNERLATQYIVDVLLRENISHPYIWPTEQVI